MKPNKTAPIKALQNPHLREKPSTKAAANPKIIALMTIENKPKVKNVMGKEKNAITGRTKTLIEAKIMAEINALWKLLISTPVGNLEIRNRVTEVTKKVTNEPIGLTKNIKKDSGTKLLRI